MSLFDQFDTAQDYFPWKCNDYAELQTRDTNSEINAHNPIDFEPENGDGRRDDPANVVTLWNNRTNNETFYKNR